MTKTTTAPKGRISQPTLELKAADGDTPAELLIHDEIGPSWLGGIDSKSVAEALAGLKDEDPLTVRINSPGGDVFDGVAIYQRLARRKGETTVVVEGLAASIASVIAMAGDKIQIGGNAMMMVHNPWTVTAGEAKDHEKAVEVLNKIRDTLVDTYHARTGIEAAEVQKLMDAETWLKPAEAVEMGFADEQIELAKPAARFDRERLKDVFRFKHVPEQLTDPDEGADGSGVPARPKPAPAGDAAAAEAAEAAADRPRFNLARRRLELMAVE